jgi:cation transport ATPase
MLPGDHRQAAEGIARRAGVPLLESDNALREIRRRQGRGAFIAFAADSAQAAAAFDACDLAIGLSTGRSSRFPARADLLAPDLEGVAAIVEAGARRQAAVRDSVALSALSNAVGIVWGLRGDPGILRATLGMYTSALAALADGWLRLAGGRASLAPRSLRIAQDSTPSRAWGLPGAICSR